MNPTLTIALRDADEADALSLASRLRLAAEAARAQSNGPAVPAPSGDVLADCERLSGLLGDAELNGIVSEFCRVADLAAGRTPRVVPVPQANPKPAPAPAAPVAAVPPAAASSKLQPSGDMRLLTGPEMLALRTKLDAVRVTLEDEWSKRRATAALPLPKPTLYTKPAASISPFAQADIAALRQHCAALADRLGVPDEATAAFNQATAAARSAADAELSEQETAVSSSKGRPSAKDLARPAGARLAELRGEAGNENPRTVRPMSAKERLAALRK